MANIASEAAEKWFDSLDEDSTNAQLEMATEQTMMCWAFDAGVAHQKAEQDLAIARAVLAESGWWHTRVVAMAYMCDQKKLRTETRARIAENESAVERITDGQKAQETK